MIDDELLQELLAKASGLYNSGDYRGAITAWKEALATDPSSQKAREGIQMATLLLGDWEPEAQIVEAPDPAAAADGSEVASARLTPEERAARVDDGITRVRSLLRERQYSAAVEGARSLVPIDPDSDEVQRLVEEAQQAFESAPFIDEHLTLARELAAQDRLSEAEAECQKVFSLDPANPDALALSAELRARMQAPEPDPGAGGVTMRMEIADLMAAEEGASAAEDTDAGLAGHADEPMPETAGQDPVVASLPDDLLEMDLLSEEPAGAGTSGPEPGDVGRDMDAPSDAVPSEEWQLETVPDLEASLAGAPDDATSAGEEMVLETQIGQEPTAQPDSTVTEGEGDEIVDAQTVVPPSVRLVPRAGDREDSVEAFLEKSEDVISIPLARPGSAAPSAPARAPAPAAPADPLGWEEELESLNLKSGEDEIVGRRGLKSATAAAPAGGDMDLAELLGDPIGSLSDDPVPAPEPAASAETPAEPPPAAPSSFEEPAMDPVVAEEHVAVRRAFTRPSVARSRARELAPAAPARQRSSVSPTMFAMLGVVILAGAAAVWWFVYQPRIAAAQAAAPPAGDPPAGSADRGPGSGPIPTPLGSTSRQPAEPAASGAEVAAAVPEEAPADARVAPAGPGSDDAGSAGSAEPAPARPRPSAEALRREAVQHMSDGRRLMAAGKWQEARTALAAALALDPVNFECKELLDRVQVKVDEEVKVTRDLDEARRAFADKDYQAALWKLYRLPRDPRLGDIERYIRNAWYNWAVVGLKGGDATDARQKLAEVLSADPGDEDAQKLLDVAERYSSRAKDRVYYSFADNLKLRAFDQE